jgi:pimeloyl-ACP methyl ester carboxylesterase
VVLLHGQPGTGGDWQWVVPHLAGRYTVVTPDRPGYGATGGRAVGFAANAEAVVRLLDRLGLERAVAVGHSWAGGVVMALAAGHPDRTSGAVLVSSIGPGERFGWDDRLLGLPVIGELMAAATVGGIGLVLGRSRVQHLARQRLAGTAADALDALTRLTAGRPGVWRSFVEEQRALLGELPGLGPDLRRITAPTAVVHGDRDRLVPLAMAEANAAAIPGATLRVLPGAGHLLPHDHPEAVAAAVDEVVGRAGSGPTPSDG